MKTLSGKILEQLGWKITGDFGDIKKSVTIFAPHTAHIDAIYGKLGFFESCFNDLGYDCIITCGTDSHPDTDPHTHGYALDFRTKHITKESDKRAIVERITDALGDYYFIQFETGESEHIHAQVRKGLWQQLMQREG